MRIITKAIMAAVLLIPSITNAQFSESYTFLKAVRDRDGTVATNILSKPGSVIIDTKDATTGETALHIVTRGRDLNWMNFLLYREARPDIRDGQGNTALMISAQIGFIEGAQLLLGKHASVDLGNGSGETPLIRAVQNHDPTMVRLLMISGANPNKADTGSGLSARDYALQDRRSSAILKIIDETKATPTVRKSAGPSL